MLNQVDKKYLPKDNRFECGCKVGEDNHCPDIKEGEFKFKGNQSIYALCNATKSYLIVKDDDGCETKWNAVWPDGLTTINCEGDFKVKYKWDACLQEEPKFGLTKCTCCEGCGKGGK